MKKCAFVRSEKSGNSCPFGLPITQACENAGNSVSRMCPLSMIEENKKELIKMANARVYVYYKTGARCLYAANIMKNQEATNCDFGDSAAGMHAPQMMGSPLYTQTFAGVGLDGLYAYPLGFYADNNQSRNLFEGLFSLVGAENFDIIKQAISQNIIEKLENNTKLTTAEELELESFVEDCKNIYDAELDTNEKVDRITRKWRRQ